MISEFLIITFLFLFRIVGIKNNISGILFATETHNFNFINFIKFLLHRDI